MNYKEDLTGKTFGYLTVICIDESYQGKRGHWVCKCKCGNTKSVETSALKSGKTKSCGCKKFETHNATHGMKHTRIYGIWCGMKKRCNNPHCKSYENYGARGIQVCEKWKNNFEAFYNWSIANGYSDNLTIDRINVNGNYSPENCRWITPFEQQSNKTNLIMITHNGESKCLSHWCKELDFDYKKAYYRFYEAKKKGINLDFEQIFN